MEQIEFHLTGFCVPSPTPPCKVKVTKVNTLILRGKLKSFKGSLGYRKDQKKAKSLTKEKKFFEN